LPAGITGICRDINCQGKIALSANVVVTSGKPSEQVGVRLRPIPCEPGDTNCDQFVDVDDLVTVILHWNQKGGDADVDGNGLVDVGDLLVVLMNWQPVRISSGADAVSEPELNHAACA
jgi:hypothetical protein